MGRLPRVPLPVLADMKMAPSLPLRSFAALAFALAALAGCGAAADYSGRAQASSGRWGQPGTGMMASESAQADDADLGYDSPAQGAPVPEAPPPPPAPPGPPPAPQEPHGVPGKGAPATEVASPRAPVLIYTAELTLSVFQVDASLGEVEALARTLGGFLSRRDDMSITVRVPAARFDEAVRSIEKLGDVQHRNVTVQDVTEEFVDLEIRARNARAVRERLVALLSKATNVEESVLLERELARVSGEIERFEGRLKLLRDRASLSTITVRFQPHRSKDPVAGPFRLPVPWLDELGLGRLLRL